MAGKPIKGQDERGPYAIAHSKDIAKRTRYVEVALKGAVYEVLEDDGSTYGAIPGFPGVYANGPSRQECADELAEVLDEWLQLRLGWGREVPVIDGIDLNDK